MYRSGSGRSGPSSSSSSHRLKESGSAGPRASRSGTSGPGPGRGRPPPPPPPPAAASAAASPPRCASPRPPPPPPPPPPRRHRSPSGHRGASRRSPSPHRSRRLPSPPGGAGGPGGGRGGRRGSEHGDGSGRRRSPSLRSESSLEQSLRITVGNDRYCIGTPERRRLPDRLGSPIDNLSDRDDMADGPIFTRGLSCSRGLERYPSHEDQPSSPFMRHDEDYRNRDVFLHRSDYSPHYGRREELPRGSDRDGDKLRKSSYPSRPEERGREIKRPRYEKDEKMHGVSGEHQGFSSGTRNYRRRSRSRSRSPSPSYLNEEFRELDRARRKREEEERSRNLNHDVSGSGYVIPGLTNALQTSEPRYPYRPEEIPSMPKKSILKKRVEMEVESPIQPEGFSSSPAPSKDLPLLSSHSSLPQSNSTAPFASEVENFLKRFNKDSVVESANKELRDGLYEWSPLSGAPKDAFTFEEKFGSFLSHKEKIEAKSEPADRHTDFLLPHERASQDGSGFSRILGMMADSVSAQEKRRRSFPDIEDEEKFLYGDEDEDIKTESLPVQKPPVSCGNEIISQKVSPPPTPAPAVKLDPLEEPNAEYAKIHDLLKTIGLDIGVAEIGKLAVRTQERLHGKKLASRSPDRRSADLRRLDHWDLRRSRSDTRSPESGQQRSASPAISFQQSKDASSLQKSEYAKNKPVGQDIPPCAPEQPLPPVSLIPSVPPAPANMPPTPTSVSQYQIPNYSQFTATQMPQNYPPPTMAPPGYDAYGHYMAYAAPGWPMYPPTQQPNPTLPEAHGLLTMAMSANPTRPNLRVIETVSMGKNVPDLKRDGSVLVHVPTTPAHSKVPLRLSSHNLKSTTEKMSDEKNRAAQKQKVIEEREKLKNEREARQKKLYYLKTELDRLRKQQGEMLRKKRREKDGHKDPLLVEVNRLQENIMKEISELHKESDAAEKKQSELDKVAQILGINIFEKPRKPSVETKDSSEKNSKSENAKGVEKASSSNKESKPANEKSRGRSPKPAESSTQSSKHPFQLANIYEYYDAGNHWCKDCNTICGTMFDFFTHMHNKKHRQTLDPYNRPWASKTQSETKQDSIKRIDKITVPAKGSEFLIPITGYYCQLCHEFFGDQISAEQHVKSHPHNEKYKKYIDENPLYEERRNLDRQAGLAVVLETERRRQSELKRKLVEKQKEEKDEKKPKIIKKEETKNIPELGEGANETQGKIDSSGRKMGIKLKLKKEEKEEKKEEKKEEPKKESSQMSFGKFSWKKTERGEDKGLGVAIPKEEGVEGIKEENKCQSGKLHAKPIEIKLSGKTVIPHTSPWTPVVSTSTQAKILPNLPVPTMIFRKSTTATVSKPPPLNTFLSIKSSGATTKPLPVVKETNTDLVLPPDIISKAFGGEEVILKGSEEDLKAAEKNESSQTSDIPPHPPLPPAVQQAAVIPADEVAPGVSESEQTMLAMLVRPPPPPPPSTAFSEQAKKVEKRNSCLATANAKDLYDIFYSSGGKGSADSKLASSALPNGENSNLAKPADLPANPRASNSSSSFKEDQNVATEVSQVLSAKRGSETEKTVTQQTSVPHSEMSTDIENGIQKDRGQKFQTLSADVQTKSKEEDSWQCNTQVAGSWVLGENPAEMNKKTLQPELSERSVTELPETKTASGVQMPAEMGLVDVASREQAGRQEFCDLQKTEVQGKVGQDDTNKTAVTKTNVPGTLEKYEEMKEVNAVKPELSLEHPKTLLPETRNEIQTLGNSHLVEEKLSDSSRTASKTDSPQLLCGSQNTSKENVLVAVMTEQNSTDTPLKDAKLNSVALEVPQPGVRGETPRISETQNKILELTRSPGECDTSRTSNGEEQVMTTSSCSESGWELSSTPNIEMKSGSDKICASEFTEIQPETCLTDTETRNSTSEAQEKIRPELSGRAVLHNQTQRQGVAWLVNACSANIVELRSSVELVVEVEKKSLGHTGSDVILDDIFAKRDAKEVGTAGFSRTCSDLVQESAVALSADVCVEHLSEEAVHSLEKKCEVIRTSAANSDFRLNTAHSGFKTEQSESLSPNVSVDHKKDSLRSENVKRNETLSEKAELEVKSTDTNLANTKGKCEHLSILSAGLLHKNMEEVSKLEAVASIRLESSKVSKADIGKPVNETEITDVAALTSGTREDKLCTQVSQTAVSQRGLQSSNSDSTEVGMPVLEMQGISPVSEILLQAEESKGGAAEMPSLSCDGGSTESQASGCVETFLPGLKETHGKNGGSGGKGVSTIQTKKTEQTETADSSLEATTNSGIAESVAESPVG